MKYLKIVLKLVILLFSFSMISCKSQKLDSTIITGGVPTTRISAILYGSDVHPLGNARMDLAVQFIGHLRQILLTH